MFVYTVYGLPGITRRQEPRRVSPVSEVEGILPVRPGWMVGMTAGSQRPARGIETQKAARGYLQALRQTGQPVSRLEPAPAAEPKAPKAPEAFFLVNAQALVVSHRRPRSEKDPDFTGSLARLRQRSEPPAAHESPAYSNGGKAMEIKSIEPA